MQNSEAESLCHIAVLLFFENFNYLLDDNVIVSISDILDSSEGWNDNTNQRCNCVLERFVCHIKDFKQKLEVLILSDFKDVPSDELLNKAFSKLGSNLESVNSEAQKNFNDSFDILVLKMLLKFLLVVFNDWLTDKFRSFNSAFVDDYFMMLSQLDFVVLYRVIQRFVFLVSVFDVMNYLKKVDWNRKYLPTCLKHLLVLFYHDFVLLLELELGLGFWGVSF